MALLDLNIQELAYVAFIAKWRGLDLNNKAQLAKAIEVAFIRLN